MIYANVSPHTIDVLIADLGKPAAALLALAARQDCIVGRQDQELAPFTMQAVLGLPWVAIIRDDTRPHRPSRGPDGYHAASMVALLRAAYAVSLVVCEIEPGNYNAAAALALTRRSSVIIETNTDQVEAWVAFIDAVAEGKRFSGDLAEIVARAR